MRALEPNKRGKDIALPEDVQEKVEELRTLSKKAEAGDKGARRELKQALLESSAAVIARASDVGRKAQHLLIDTAAAGDPLTELALSGRLDLMRAEIAGEEPTPLEKVLAERVVTVWTFLQVLDIFVSIQLGRETSKKVRASASTTKFYLDWQERAHRQLLNSTKTLAQVRKLQENTPRLQVNNTQVNIGRGETE